MANTNPVKFIGRIVENFSGFLWGLIDLSFLRCTELLQSEVPIA
jgi:hypothetical protein